MTKYNKRLPDRGRAPAPQSDITSDIPSARANASQAPPEGQTPSRPPMPSERRSRAQSEDDQISGLLDVPFPPGYLEQTHKPVTIPEMPEPRTLREQIEQVLQVVRLQPLTYQLREYLEGLDEVALLEVRALALLGRDGREAGYHTWRNIQRRANRSAEETAYEFSGKPFAKWMERGLLWAEEQGHSFE